jgi:hypothetical protein
MLHLPGSIKYHTTIKESCPVEDNNKIMPEMEMVAYVNQFME